MIDLQKKKKKKKKKKKEEQFVNKYLRGLHQFNNGVLKSKSKW
jgi:hypothetical protein